MSESSSYPLSTTACRWARVTESLLANNVTSQPRATSPSVMLLATVSQAPYCRGGVRQATGDRTATLLLGIVMLFNDLSTAVAQALLPAGSRLPVCGSVPDISTLLLARCMRQA